MLKKATILFVILALVTCMSACGKETKELTCDGCGKTVAVEADSNMDDSWILFCEECGEPGVE